MQDSDIDLLMWAGALHEIGVIAKKLPQHSAYLVLNTDSRLRPARSGNHGDADCRTQRKAASSLLDSVAKKTGKRGQNDRATAPRRDSQTRRGA